MDASTLPMKDRKIEAFAFKLARRNLYRAIPAGTQHFGFAVSFKGKCHELDIYDKQARGARVHSIKLSTLRNPHSTTSDVSDECLNNFVTNQIPFHTF